MNVIIVNDFAHINGGASAVALASAHGLAERGHRVFVFCAVGPVGKELDHPNIRVVLTEQHEIAKDPNKARAFTQGIWNKKAKSLFLDLVGELHPAESVTHIHGWSKALSSSWISTCKERQIPLVCTLHDYFAACPNGGLFNFKSGKVCELQPMSVNCIVSHCDSRNFAYKQWRVLRQITQIRAGMPGEIDAFIAVSDFSKRILEGYLPRTAPIFRIDNPIESVKEPPVVIHNDAPFIFVGRLSKEKGLDLLADASEGISSKLVLVGDGPEGSRMRNLFPLAEITGWVGRHEVRNYLRKARALILPSIWYETQGMVVAEAAACGLPSIVSDSCAARDMVVDRETGMWFKGGDSNSLRAAMQKLFDRDLARQLGAAAYQRFWENPPLLEKHVLQLERCYAEVSAVKQRGQKPN